MVYDDLSFVENALAKGVHWIYITTVIDQGCGRVTERQADRIDTCRTGKLPDPVYDHDFPLK